MHENYVPRITQKQKPAQLSGHATSFLHQESLVRWVQRYPRTSDGNSLRNRNAFNMVALLKVGGFFHSDLNW